MGVAIEKSSRRDHNRLRVIERFPKTDDALRCRIVSNPQMGGFAFLELF